MEIEVRQAGLEDVPRIVEMASEFNRHMTKLGRPATVPITLANFEKYGFGNLPRFSALIATCRSGTSLGYGVYYFGIDMEQCAPVAHLTELFVKDEFRGYRVGQKLVDELRVVAHGAEACRIYCEVPHYNKAAVGFYQKLGFINYQDKQPESFLSLSL